MNGQKDSYGARCLDMPFTSTQPDIPSRAFILPLTLHLEHSSLLVDPPIHGVLTQSRIERRALAQNSDSSDLMLPCDHHCSRDAPGSWALKPVTASSGRGHVQCRLAAKIAGIEDLEQIEFSTTRSPAVEG